MKPTTEGHLNRLTRPGSESSPPCPIYPKPAQAWSHLKHEGQCVKARQNVFKVRSSLKSKSVLLCPLRYENVSMDKGWKMHPAVSLKYGDVQNNKSIT